MSFMIHHTIIVTGHDRERLELVRDDAADLGLRPSAIMTSPVNSYHTFVVPPDGSLEGWDASDAAESMRARLIATMQTEGVVDWVLVAYGGDSYPHGAVVEACSGGATEI